jgi:site-specific DNA-methyltransferase (adenine-specific)
MSQFQIYTEDCFVILKTLKENSIDSIVTDPPYGLSFMGKKWDYDVPSQEIWTECLRVLKPGGHLLAFAGTRTQHRMAVRIEDAGFEIRDMIAWVYGSGFPKSHNLKNNWKGWGTALKPALEPITVARKPLIGTVAENVLEHGTGAINVDGCRVEGAPPKVTGQGWNGSTGYGRGDDAEVCEFNQPAGRWPANFIHDGSDEPCALLSDAARFFYCAKASKADRDEGLEGFEVKRTGGMQATADGSMLTGSGNERTTSRANIHPTVKPIDLMRYLCRLVTPPSGVVLDPFMGSGSTGKAAMLEGFQFIGIEQNKEYAEIAKARIENTNRQKTII